MIGELFKNTFFFCYVSRGFKKNLYLIVNLKTVMALRGAIISRGFHSSLVKQEVHKLTRLRVVDNSEIGKQAMLEGKPAKCIHIYNKRGVGFIGK